MKSLISILALGVMFIESHVSGAPQSTTALAAPTSIETTALESTASASPEMDDDEPEAETFSSGPADMRTMERRYRTYIRQTLRRRLSSHTCTLEKISVRKEWGAMTREDRINYTNAVKCLYSRSPPLSNLADVPGARNRNDDFVASHIQQGQNIHFNGYLFTWHRHFVWIYEQALRNECGYKGPMPYWDWTLYPDDPRLSPVFDGSETSMSGNGEAVPHNGTRLTDFGLDVTLPPGTGGGCVKDGPFADLQVNLGFTPTILQASSEDLVLNTSSFGVIARADPSKVPANSSSSTLTPRQIPNYVTEALKYNPRCLTRDINPFWSNQIRTKDVEFLLSCDNVDCLEKRADGWELDQSTPQPGLHVAGHSAVGGLMSDSFAAPGDPAFYPHHTAFDRLYSIWQAQDAEKRVYQVGGTRTPFNIPPSDPVTPDDTIDFGVISNSVKVRDVLSTIDGPFCYMYE